MFPIVPKVVRFNPSCELPINTLSVVGLSYNITAPTVPGYTFKCWIGSQTNGFASINYVINKLNAEAQVWAKSVGSDFTVSSNSISASPFKKLVGRLGK